MKATVRRFPVLYRGSGAHGCQSHIEFSKILLLQVGDCQGKTQRFQLDAPGIEHIQCHRVQRRDSRALIPACLHQSLALEHAQDFAQGRAAHSKALREFPFREPGTWGIDSLQNQLAQALVERCDSTCLLVFSWRSCCLDLCHKSTFQMFLFSIIHLRASGKGTRPPSDCESSQLARSQLLQYHLSARTGEADAWHLSRMASLSRSNLRVPVS